MTDPIQKCLEWAEALKPPSTNFNAMAKIDSLCDRVKYCDLYLQRLGINSTQPITRLAKSLDPLFTHEVNDGDRTIRVNDATVKLVDEVWQQCRDAFVGLLKERQTGGLT